MFRFEEDFRFKGSVYVIEKYTKKEHKKFEGELEWKGDYYDRVTHGSGIVFDEDISEYFEADYNEYRKPNGTKIPERYCFLYEGTGTYKRPDGSQYVGYLQKSRAQE